MRVSVGAKESPESCAWPAEPMISASATSMAAGTAQRRATRRKTSQVPMIPAASHGRCWNVVTGTRHSSSSTPASSAFASGRGTASTRRRSGSNTPVHTISAPQIANAVTAAPKPPRGTPVVTSSAAPGVDQAMLIGMRKRTLTTTASTPMITLAVSSPEAACS